MRYVYADNAATTPVSKKVVEAIIPYMTEHYGNPSSLYEVGQVAHRAVEKARQQVATALNAEKEEIFFTSGGSEADNWAIRGAAALGAKKGKKYLITSKFDAFFVSRLGEVGTKALDSSLLLFIPALIVVAGIFLSGKETVKKMTLKHMTEDITEGMLKVVPTAAYFPHLENKDTFIAYLDSLNIQTNSYSAGNTLTAQKGQITERDKQLAASNAGYSLMDIFLVVFILIMECQE